MEQFRTVVKNVKPLQKKSRTHEVSRLEYGLGFKVVSGKSGRTYFVAYNLASRRFVCNCDWGKYNGGACSHVQAVVDFIEQEYGRVASFWASEEAAARQRRPASLLAEGRDETQVWVTTRKA